MNGSFIAYRSASTSLRHLNSLVSLGSLMAATRLIVDRHSAKRTVY